MEQVQRAALPIFMQERMAALESAGYAVQETCRDNDHFTAGLENQQGRVLVIVGKAETGGRLACIDQQVTGENERMTNDEKTDC